MNRLLPLCVWMSAACSPSSRGTPASSSEPPPDSKPTLSAPSGTVLELASSDRGKPQTMRVGDTLGIKLSDSAQGLHRDYRYGWGTPTVEGGALEFVGRKTTNPPADVDGGSPRERFEFRAISPGQATVSIPVKSAGAEANASGFVVSVAVTDRS